jgi:hypothetical protein
MSLLFFRKLFNKQTSQYPLSLFDNAPFLAPWYFTDSKPVLIKDGKNLKWKYIDKVNDEYVGLLTLRDPIDNIFGLVNIYNYIHSSADKTKFLIWNRATKVDTLNPCVTMHLYETTQLVPLDKSDISLLTHYKSNKSFYFAHKPTTTIKYFIEPFIKENNFSFPTEFKIFDPFLIVAEYEGLYDGSKELGNTLILEFNPRANMINCYLQDWFNKSNADLGYQWITRAVRDSNGIIHGQGIRISDFTLDETGTQLKK